jgi:hypothetical protein
MKPPRFPDLIQPKDPNHVLYKMVDEFLINGDLKLIRIELNVTAQTVSDVKRGAARSKRVWAKIIEVVMKRKEQQDAFMTYMSKPLPQSQAA